MLHQALQDPLGTAKIVTTLIQHLKNLSLNPVVDNDLANLAQARLLARNEQVSPYFDTKICDFTNGRAFWMMLKNNKGDIVGLQAFRIDNVEDNLADWALTYSIGLYMRRQEILVPLQPSPPRKSMSEQLKGRLVYHGELWLSPQIKHRHVVWLFGRLGLLVSLLKWHPDAVWALVGQTMATRGTMLNMGYPCLERGFFRWHWAPTNAEQIEWVAIIDRSGLERLIDETLTTPQIYEVQKKVEASFSQKVLNNPDSNLSNLRND